MSLKRSKVSSSRVASFLNVAQSDVLLWRAGATVPDSAQCHQLADMLKWMWAGCLVATGKLLRLNRENLTLGQSG
jgi:hypothetical protein